MRKLLRRYITLIQQVFGFCRNVRQQIDKFDLRNSYRKYSGGSSRGLSEWIFQPSNARCAILHQPLHIVSILQEQGSLVAPAAAEAMSLFVSNHVIYHGITRPNWAHANAEHMLAFRDCLLPFYSKSKGRKNSQFSLAASFLEQCQFPVVHIWFTEKLKPSCVLRPRSQFLNPTVD